ncbi:MAG: acyl-CoA dehydrogenase family protein [Rhodospirillales bacterium]
MDFAPSREQSAVFDMAQGFAAERIAPFAAQWEDDRTIPRDVLEAAGALGLGGILVSAEHGGSDMTRLDGALAFEAMAMACPSVAAFISIHNMCASMIDTFGSAEMRAARLPDMCRMTKIASYCLTEPDSGSDAAALKTRAEQTNTGWRLNGTKAFISGGDYSDLYVVMCRTGAEGPKGISAVVVESGRDGLSFGAQERKMGWRAQPTAQVNLDNCEIPAENLIGEAGDGFKYAMAGLDGGRLNISACSLGAAQAAFDKALDYTGERKAFGQTLDQFQSVQFKLADMETRLQAARVFLRQAAWKLDTGAPDASKHCAMAKRLVTDEAFDIANDALQLLGGYGYLSSYGIEKIVRDLRVHQILEGTNEIMRLIISRALLEERSSRA